MKNQTKESKSWGVASLVVGIIGLLGFLAPYFGLPLSILAVVAAYKQNKVNPDGYASAGNVLGIIGIVVNGIMLLLVLLFLAIMPGAFLL